MARQHGWRDLDDFTTWQRTENTRRYAEEIEQQSGTVPNSPNSWTGAPDPGRGTGHA